MTVDPHIMNNGASSQNNIVLPKINVSTTPGKNNYVGSVVVKGGRGGAGKTKDSNLIPGLKTGARKSMA